MVSILLGVWNGGGVCCCCPAQCGGVARLTHPIAVLASTAVMPCIVSCQVCGVVSGGCVSVLFVWWGILCLLPPHSGGGWGHRGWWGVCCGGGWHGEGRAAVLLTPRRMLVSLVLCVVSPFRLRGGRVEWREWRVVCCPRVWIGFSPFILFSPLLHCLASPIFLPPFPSFVFSVTALLFSAASL